MIGDIIRAVVMARDGTDEPTELTVRDAQLGKHTRQHEDVIGQLHLREQTSSRQRQECSGSHGMSCQHCSVNFPAPICCSPALAVFGELQVALESIHRNCEKHAAAKGLLVEALQIRNYGAQSPAAAQPSQRSAKS